MKWSPEQDAAMRSVNSWLRDGDQQIFRLFGYAGSGKTTMARTLAEGVDGDVLFGAYTGKAAHVLRQKGCSGASTIHQMIYNPKDSGRARLKELEAGLAEALYEIRSECRVQDGMSEGEIQEVIDRDRGIRELRRKIEAEREALSRPAFTLNPESPVKNASLVVIDECSMVDGRMGQDLLQFGTKVLVLGDPAQLPPVGGTGFFTEGCDPDIMLTGIHRQASDNPIIWMATETRQERSLQLGRYGESLVIEQERTDHEMALAADQILVGRNTTRRASNRRVRQLMGRHDLLPVPDDKLVCLRNNHDKGLLNGAIWEVDDVGQVSGDQVYMTISPEDGGTPLGVDAHTHYFLGEEERLSWWERKDAEEFDYGYALTCHKAQGSQWGDVIVYDESSCFRADRWRWLYTALTRAADRVTLVRM